MSFRASRSGQYTGILVLRQFLKIEQTISHGYQPLAFDHLAYPSWFIASRHSLYSVPSSHVYWFHCIVFYPISSHSRSFENHRLGCLINFHDVVFFFPSAPLFLQLLCLRTYFALSKALLFPDHIVAHRLLRRPHDGASASPTFTLGGRCGYLSLVRYGPNFFYLSCLSFGGRSSISFLTSFLSPVHLLLLFTLPMPDDFSLTNSLSPFFACWRG